MKHRGKHPQDKQLFGQQTQLWSLQEAVRDLSFLLDRGYAEKSASELVGNRYRLRKRQKKALLLMSSGQEAQANRLNKQIPAEMLAGETLYIDGYNLLIGMEAALSQGYLLECEDGQIRDLASVHGSYKKVMETQKAIEIMGQALLDLEVKKAHWIFDRPISNSGKLKQEMLQMAQENNWPWEVELAFNPDKELVQLNKLTASSDAWILDRVDRSFNFMSYLVRNYVPDAELISLYDMA